MMQTQYSRPLRTASRRAPVTGKPGMNISQTSSRPSTRPRLIKDLIRRCQFPQEEQESRKIDFLYHATAHFEVMKFVHDAKQEELKYDRMIEVAKAHERTCQEYQIHKQAHSMASPSNYSNPLIQTSTLSKFFQKDPPKKTCGKCGCSQNHRECPSSWYYMQQVWPVKSLGSAIQKLWEEEQFNWSLTLPRKATE